MKNTVKFVDLKGETLKYNFDDYDTYIDILPYTGWTLNAKKRLAASCQFGGSTVLFMQDRGDIFFPLYMVEQTGGITEEQAGSLNGAFAAIEGFLVGIFLGLLITGLFLVLIGFGVCVGCIVMNKDKGGGGGGDGGVTVTTTKDADKV